MSQPLNETEVLILVEQMLRSKTVDERYISDIMGRLTSVVGLPQNIDLSRNPPTHSPTHPPPPMGIQRSKSVKEEITRSRSSKSNRPANPVDGESKNTVKLMRSTSLKSEKNSKVVKKHPQHEEPIIPPPPHASLPAHIPSQAMYSKSMHNLNFTNTKEQLVGWMETQQRASAMKKAHLTASAQQVNLLHNQPPNNPAAIPQQPKKLFQSTPDVYTTSQPQGYTRQVWL